MNLPKNLTTKQAAKFLKVSITSIYNYYAEGRLDCVKHQSPMQFDLEELERVKKELKDPDWKIEQKAANQKRLQARGAYY